MSSNTAAERLGEAVKLRRLELDMNQIDVWQSGGPSNTWLTDVENGRLKELRTAEAKKLDHALRWEPGSARRVWAGTGQPHPVIGDLSGRASAQLREIILGIRDLPPETREALLDVLKDEGQRARGA